MTFTRDKIKFQKRAKRRLNCFMSVRWKLTLSFTCFKRKEIFTKDQQCQYISNGTATEILRFSQQFINYRSKRMTNLKKKKEKIEYGSHMETRCRPNKNKNTNGFLQNIYEAENVRVCPSYGISRLIFPKNIPATNFKLNS